MPHHSDMKNIAYQLMCVLALFALHKEEAAADSWAPPQNFVDSPRPVLASADKLVAHTETISISRNLQAVLMAANRPLKDQINPSSELPGINGSYMLTPGEFGAVALATSQLFDRRFHTRRRSAS